MTCQVSRTRPRLARLSDLGAAGELPPSGGGVQFSGDLELGFSDKFQTRRWLLHFVYGAAPTVLQAPEGSCWKQRALSKPFGRKKRKQSPAPRLLPSPSQKGASRVLDPNWLSTSKPQGDSPASVHFCIKQSKLQWPDTIASPSRSLYLATQDQTLLERLRRLTLFGTDFFFPRAAKFLISSQIKLVLVLCVMHVVVSSSFIT